MTDEMRLKLKLADLEMRIESLENQIQAMVKTNCKPYYSVKEFAEIMSVNPITIYNRIHEGQIDAVRIGKSYRIPHKNLI